MDIRIPGLPHSVVKHAQRTSVREQIQKIENHPDRHTLRQDLRQNQPYNPFSPESKKMTQEASNTEPFEPPEVNPKTQCTACLSDWNAGIVYCTCWHFLHKERGQSKIRQKKTMDLLSLSVYAIKKGRLHGRRYGKKPGDKEYHQAHNLSKRCIKKKFKAIHIRFLRDPYFRNEDVCIKMDERADKNSIE